MTPEIKRRIQYLLLVAIVLATFRSGYILYHRHASSPAEHTPGKPASPPLDADYYVIPKKLHAYDLKSARELTRQPVWVKEGYRYTFYSYNPANRKVDFEHAAGQLLPLEKLDIQNVVAVSTPQAFRQQLPGGAVLEGEKQVIGLFGYNGTHYAVPIGTELGGDYHIYADEMFFIQDPKELYKHWPADVWDAVDKHQVKPGMNELQTDFAIGMGVPEPSHEADVKTVSYPNGGKPVRVTFRNGKAVEIQRSSG
ncbi:MAG: hypothetical protein JO249_06955 [Acidobacteria bacterium]|nr:hypothetical protein [Acidobacteriota bacterium]